MQRDDVVRGFDLSGSVTYADAITRRNTAFPAAQGKRLPSVPNRKAVAVATWHPADRIALTAAGRYASRNYATLDNSDTVGNTYQGLYRYLVFDLRAQVKVTPHYTLAVGVDDVGNDRYFLFHPLPRRTFHADVTVTL